jgi:hypothetical protein
MADDHLCDTCKQPLKITRNKKGSKYPVCVNAACAKGAKYAPKTETPAKPESKPKESDANPKRGFFSLR